MTSRTLLQFFLIVCFGVAAAAVVLFLPVEYLPFVCIAGLLAIFMVLIFRRFVWLLYGLTLFSAIVCMGSQFDSISLSGTTVSISGVGWGFAAGIILGILALQRTDRQIPKWSLAFLAFVLWTAIRWLSTPITLTGLKDILFYGLPPLSAIFTWIVLSRRGGSSIQKLENLLLATVLIPIGAYLILIPVGKVTLTGQGPVGAVEARGIALYLLIILAVALARWSYGATPRDRKTAALCGLLAVGVIFFTLSRMAVFAAILLLALGLLKPRRIRDAVVGAAAAGLITVAIILAVPPLRERFFANTSSDLVSVLLSLRTSGRNVFWAVTFQHAITNPVLGWGPGSARILVAQAVHGMDVSEYYPHNEYLQVFHDLGGIGLALLLLAYLPLWYGLWKSWRDSRLQGNRMLAGRNMSAFLGVTAILVSSVTANTLHYAFVTVPAFILVGFAFYQNRLAASPPAKIPPPPAADQSG